MLTPYLSASADDRTATVRRLRPGGRQRTPTVAAEPASAPSRANDPAGVRSDAR